MYKCHLSEDEIDHMSSSSGNKLIYIHETSTSSLFLSQISELQQDFCPHAWGLPGSSQVGVVVCFFFFFIQLFLHQITMQKSACFLRMVHSLVRFDREIICTGTVFSCNHFDN